MYNSIIEGFAGWHLKVWTLSFYKNSSPNFFILSKNSIRFSWNFMHLLPWSICLQDHRWLPLYLEVHLDLRDGLDTYQHNVKCLKYKKYFIDRFRYGILLPKLFWPTVRKKNSSDRKNLWNSSLKAENFQKFRDH